MVSSRTQSPSIRMTSEPIRIVQSVYDAFSRRDVPTVFALFAPRIHILQSAQLPWGGSYHGHEGARGFFTKLTSHITTTVTVERMIHAEDHVAVIGWTEGTVNASGRAFKVPIAHIWRVEDNLVIQVQFFIDNPTMVAALAP